MIHCPKCNEPMKPVQFAGVEVDRCAGCQGLFFDALELETLTDVDGSELIDTGDASTGLQLDQVSPVVCPRCREPMSKEYDPLQPQIQFEFCNQCFGAFLDAGEFRDFKENLFVDSLRRRAGRGRS